LSLAKSDELIEIEELNLKGEYEEALERIEVFLQRKEITKTEKIQAKILRSEVFIWLYFVAYGKLFPDKGLNSAEEAYLEAKEEENKPLMFLALVWKMINLYAFERKSEFLERFAQLKVIKSNLDSNESLDSKWQDFYFLFIKAFFHIVKAEIDENYELKRETVIKLFKEAVKVAEELGNKKWISLMLTNIGFHFRVLGNFEKAMEFSKKAVSVAEELGNDYHTIYGKLELGNVYIQKGENEEVLKIIREQKKIGDQKNNEEMIARANHNLGIFHYLMGEYKESLEYCLEYEKFLTKEGETKHTSFLYNISSIYWGLGEVDKAFEYLQRMLKILEEREVSTCPVLQQIAKIYAHKGELDKALELYERTLEYYYRLDDKINVASILQSISTIYEKKGILNKALDYLEKAEEIYLEIDAKPYLSRLYYQFIVLSTRSEQISTAKGYFGKLKNALEEIDSKNLQRLILISESLILRNSDDIEDRIRAEVLFDQLLQEDLSYEYKIEILLQLSDLLLFELKRTSNERYLEKLQDTIDTLVEIGTENNSSIIIVESLWFKSQLSLLNLEIDKARELLTQALDIAERKGFNQIALKLTKSKEQLIQQKIELEALEKTSPTISKRMEVVKVENGFKELKSKEVFEFKASEVESSRKLFSLQI
jgi:tetratricopeptide (TPR) repeat protein